MDQMAHVFTAKRKSKHQPLVMFSRLDLASTASRVVFRMKYPVDTFSHEDNVSTDIGRSLAFAQIRCTIATSPLYYLQPKPKVKQQLPPKKANMADKAGRTESKQDARCVLDGSLGKTVTAKGMEIRGGNTKPMTNNPNSFSTDITGEGSNSKPEILPRVT
ncbi:hypothetical protein PoB_006610600 [Plakobranchus ocellatus]|uniref:Uncharacterized protein n=1 Tax=Plakobranchus ocellatus TaxID=259542 RepID=A0AAV4D6N1_9GAST|nr:hypothetical protein PoB_006610600 [Plakobranchus ocellatus]